MANILSRWIDWYLNFSGIRLSLDGGGASSTPTSTTTTSNSLPAYAQPYMESTLGRTASLTDINQNPYKSYGGQQYAGDSPLQKQAYNTLGNLGAPGAQSGWNGSGGGGRYYPMTDQMKGLGIGSMLGGAFGQQPQQDGNRIEYVGGSEGWTGQPVSIDGKPPSGPGSAAWAALDASTASYNQPGGPGYAAETPEQRQRRLFAELDASTATYNQPGGPGYRG